LNLADHSHTKNHRSEWQFLGELELPAGANLYESIHTWLTKLFDPLALPGEFLNRIRKSAQDAAARVFQSESALKYDHIHLVIYGPHEQVSKQGTWGFFRVEKVENIAEETSTAAHSIEFYLYRDGQA
jgi:hypothetical protein